MRDRLVSIVLTLAAFPVAFALGVLVAACERVG